MSNLNSDSEYKNWLYNLKENVKKSQIKASISINKELLVLYLDLGIQIIAKQEASNWGSNFLGQLSKDLQAEFPLMTGFSKRNLELIRQWTLFYFSNTKQAASQLVDPISVIANQPVSQLDEPSFAIAKQLVSQLPWGQIIRLLQMVKDPAVRQFYIRETITNGWSRSILELNIQRQLHLRVGKAQNNFVNTMPPADSDMATQIFKDPYLFDFIGTADPRREAEVEQALVDHIQKFLLELGRGFAFVGRQVRLEVGDQDFVLDLLFYHLTLRRYVVIELKARDFQPSDVGQINLYRAAVDDLLRHPDDQPSIGLLLCKGRNRLVAEYALDGLENAIAVAEWQTQLTQSLPEGLRSSLPTIAEIEAELAEELAPVKKRTKAGKP